MIANLGDVELSYLDQGDGPVLVLLHGFPLNQSIWKYQVAEFAKSHRVVAPDLRGHGRSTVTVGTVTMLDMAQDVAGLLDHLHVDEPVHLGGLSMGGYVAWEFWRQFPDRLRSLLLFDTRAQADAEEVSRGRKMMAAQVVTEGSEMAADSMVPKLVSQATQDTHPALVEDVRSMILGTHPEAIAAAQRGMAERIDMTDKLARVKTRALVVCGEHDGISTPEEMRGIAAAMPNATFQLIPEAGHLAPWEQPRAVNQAMREFLAS